MIGTLKIFSCKLECGGEGLTTILFSSALSKAIASEGFRDATKSATRAIVSYLSNLMFLRNPKLECKVDAWRVLYNELKSKLPFKILIFLRTFFFYIWGTKYHYILTKLTASQTRILVSGYPYHCLWSLDYTWESSRACGHSTKLQILIIAPKLALIVQRGDFHLFFDYVDGFRLMKLLKFMQLSA